MLVTISCIVISITAFSVMKKPVNNRKKKKTELNCGNTTYSPLHTLGYHRRGDFSPKQPSLPPAAPMQPENEPLWLSFDFLALSTLSHLTFTNAMPHHHHHLICTTAPPFLLWILGFPSLLYYICISYILQSLLVT